MHITPSSTTFRPVVTCDVTANLNIYTGTIEDHFFSDGYPVNPRVRERLSRHEWDKLDKEFRNVWNATTASRTHCLVKALYFVPGAYLFCWGAWKLDQLDRERQLAVHECIAKLNKYVLRQRGMFMKLVQTAAGPFDGRTLYYWIQIGLDDASIQVLEQTPCYVPESTEVSVATCCGCDPNQGLPTESTCPEDVEFQSRWMVTTTGEETSLTNCCIPQ